jgi:signal transduction histidine kinase
MAGLRESSQSMPWRAIFARSKGPLKEVFKLLDPHKKTIASAWKRQIRRLGSSARGAWEVPGDANLWYAALQLPVLTFSELDRWLKHLGAELSQRHVSLARIGQTIHALSEITLSYVPSERPALLCAVLEVTIFIQGILITAYSRHQEQYLGHLRAQLRQGEKRRRRTPSYVTGVYEQERRLLSHDLHDDIGHDLVIMKMYLDLLATDLRERRLESLRSRLDDARLLVTHTLESVRRLVLDLGPAIFDELGFVSALKFYARRFSTSTGIEVTVSAGNFLERIPQSHQVCLYRVLQGALSNVLKHSRAKHVQVTLGTVRDAVLIMTIEDDGVGMDTRARQPAHRFGLRAMRERVEALEGKVRVISWRAARQGERHGTRIEVNLPLQIRGAH